eukprot:7291801-Prymnesium_polylepis.1
MKRLMQQRDDLQKECRVTEGKLRTLMGKLARNQESKEVKVPLVPACIRRTLPPCCLQVLPPSHS